MPGELKKIPTGFPSKPFGQKHSCKARREKSVTSGNSADPEFEPIVKKFLEVKQR